MAAFVTANRKASAFAVLFIVLALGAFAALCSPGELPPQSIPVIIERKLDELPGPARRALERPAFRDYGNLGGRLPVRSASYYHEHRIEGAQKDERIVRGDEGEVYYTTDNFHSATHVH